MKAIKSFLESSWNYEYKSVKEWHRKTVFAVLFIIGFGYVIIDVLFGKFHDIKNYALTDFVNFKTHEIISMPGTTFLERNFAQIWLIMAAICVISRVALITVGHIKFKKVYGDKILGQYFVTFFYSFIVTAVVGVVAVFIADQVALGLGYELSNGVNVFQQMMMQLKLYVNNHVPTLFSMHSYWLALIISIMIYGLPDHFLHWSSHNSRLLWLVFHRPHHAPEILHPLLTPPAFIFKAFVMILSGLAAITVSKLIYVDSLVMELNIWFMFGFMTEVLNHSAVFYDFTYRNPLMRNLCRLLGDRGAYHIVHHSALKVDQVINFSATPFNFWDRVFGTYRRPYEKMPPLGLTYNPEIYMNPFRVGLAGVAQIIYELRNNKGLLVKLKILFATNAFRPPVSKDYLIKQSA